MSGSADIGVVGLAVMGENLVLNMASHGYRVAVYNRTTAKVDAFPRGTRGRQDHLRARGRRRNWSRSSQDRGG